MGGIGLILLGGVMVALAPVGYFHRSWKSAWCGSGWRCIAHRRDMGLSVARMAVFQRRCVCICDVPAEYRQDPTEIKTLRPMIHAARRIEQYFAAHEDGEFSRPSRGLAFTVMGPATRTAKILYTTKVHASDCLFGENLLPGYGWIARYGLPDAADAVWLRQFARGRTLLFLGDMDPPDLLVFAWLRHKLRGIKLRHIGVNDHLLTACTLTPSSRSTIPFSVSERKALPLLDKVWPDWHATIGPTCSALLASGHKLEVEAIFSFGKATQVAEAVRSGP